MTVRELINKLEKIKNKELIIYMEFETREYDEHYNCYMDRTHFADLESVRLDEDSVSICG